MTGTSRTAVTGIGVVAPGGTTRKEFWSLLTEGRTATRRLSFSDPTPFRAEMAAAMSDVLRQARAIPSDIHYVNAHGSGTKQNDLDYVPNVARDHHVDMALSVGSGFGGFQSAAVLTRDGGGR